MSLYNLKKLDLAVIKVAGTEREDLPMWSINYYVQELCNNYLRLINIQRICELSANGAPDSCFFVADRSAELFPQKPISDTYKSVLNYITLAEKQEEAAKFWNVVTNYSRPVVFFRLEDKVFPLYDFTYEEAIKVVKLTYNSPVNIDIRGAVGTIRDLIEAPRASEMKEIDFVNKQLGQVAYNYERIVSAMQVINDKRTPEGIKLYANQALIQVLKKQSKLNEQIGIEIVRIDEKV